MGFESPRMPSPEEMAKIEKERAISDAELLKGGAEYKFDKKGEKRLEVTDEQVEKTKEEMGKDLKEKESTESKIEKLTEDEKKFFEVQKQAAETIETLDQSLKKRDINKDFYAKVSVSIEYLRKEAASPLIEKMGAIRASEIENLIILREEKEKIIKKSEDIIQKLTPENVMAAVKEAKPIEVKVKRTTGNIEKGWVVTGISGDNAIVIRPEGGGKFLRKVVLLEELKEWNKPEAKIVPEDLEKSIAETKSFGELEKVIEASSGIQGSQDFFEAEALKDIINKVRRGDKTLTAVTRTAGLKNKVAELLETEKK